MKNFRKIYLQELLEINNLLSLYNYEEQFAIMKITTIKNHKYIYFLVNIEHMVYFYSLKNNIINIISLYYCNNFIIYIYAMQNNIWEEIK
ncbi:hypothetical protein AB836_00300 [Rickettsiales bacterium (ex Bugula neritina AB1)]|nr:hypothetical protein AB836_00300 [Rickettsiales bacterium (ex Bugula neritina AB1)]